MPQNALMHGGAQDALESYLATINPKLKGAKFI